MGLVLLMCRNILRGRRTPANLTSVLFDRDVAHLLRGLSAALQANEFVVAPEGAIEEQEIAGIEFVRAVRRRLEGRPA